MKIKILRKKGAHLDFVLEGASTALANGLRRIMVSEVPVLAVEWADISDNNSALFDEVIANRLGLIPLKFDPSKFNFSDSCKCEGKGCSLCQVVFAVEKTGPCVVTSGDMKSSNKAVKPTSPDFPITELLKGQRLKVDAIARLGLGITHAKFQAANAAYNYLPSLEISKNANPKELVKRYPHAFVLKGTKLAFKDQHAPQAWDIDNLDEDVKIKPVEGSFVFRVESVSGLEPAYIVQKAAQILQEKGTTFKKDVAKL